MSDRPSDVNDIQMAVLLVAASVGSAIIYIPGPVINVAGNGAWLALAGAWAFGMLVLACVLYLHRRHGGAGLFDYCRKLLGRPIAVVVTIPVVGMLLFAIPAILTGISDFFAIGMMPRTPSFVFVAVSLMTAALTARAGIVVTARMFVLLVPVMVVFTAVVLLMAFPLYEWGRLLPPVDKGPGAVLHGLFITSGFPFGEVCLFSVLLSSVSANRNGALRKRLFFAFGLTGTLIVASTVCTIAAFGPAAGHLSYSLYQLASNVTVSVANERVEAVIGIALILGSYMKVAVFMLILNRLLVGMTGTNNEKAYLFPIGITCVFLSLTMFASPAEFQRQVYTIWPFTVIAVGCTLIFALTALTWMRGRLRIGAPPKGTAS